MTGWDELPLTTDHAELLAGCAITPQVAAGVVRSVTSTGQLPTDFLRYGQGTAPGLLFTWHRPTGDPVPQLRPDEPLALPDGDRKYLFTPRTTPPLAVHPLMRDRVMDPAVPILVVEGTKQHLAAVSALLDAETAVVGVAGCWGWSHDSKPVPDLDQIPWTGRQVYVCFDADLATNRGVWEAATALTEVLAMRGAETVRYLKVPGGKSTGLDDALATLPVPAEGMRRLLDTAADKLPRRPARKKQYPDVFDDEGALLVERFAAALRTARPMALAGDHTVAVYRDGVYRTGPLRLSALVADHLGDLFRPAHRITVEEYLAATLLEEGSMLPDRADQPVCNVANGMLDLRTGDLKPHSPAWLSAVQLPVAYDPHAECPTYERWLAERVGEQADDLEEVAATMLDPSSTPAKAIFLFGPSRSGKGTFLRLMEAVAGVENTSAVTLHQLAEDRFASANVYGKILNTAADLSAEHVRDLSVFKMLTGQDRISANRKYGRQFTFTNRALFAFSANEIPTVSESSRAYFERIKPFRFAATFAGRENPGVEKAMVDDELPGILARWVRAWQCLAARGGYAPTDPGVRTEFEAESDRVHKWVTEECQIITHIPVPGDPGSSGSSGPAPSTGSSRAASGSSETGSGGSAARSGSFDGPVLAVSAGGQVPPGCGTTKTDLYEAFGQWATAAGMSRMNRKTFLGRLTSINGVVEVRLLPTWTRALNVVVRPDNGDHNPGDADPSGSSGSSGPTLPIRADHVTDHRNDDMSYGEGGPNSARPASTADTTHSRPRHEPASTSPSRAGHDTTHDTDATRDAGWTGYSTGLSRRLNVHPRPGDPVFGPVRSTRRHLPGPGVDLLNDCPHCGARLGPREPDNLRPCAGCGRRVGNRTPQPGETVTAWEPVKCRCGRRVPVSLPGDPRPCPGCDLTYPTHPADPSDPGGEATLFDEETR